MALSLTRSRVRILSCLEKATTPVHHLFLQLCCRCWRRCENWGFPASLTFPRARARARERGRETVRERDTDIEGRTSFFCRLLFSLCWFLYAGRGNLRLLVLLVSGVCAAWVFCPSSAGWLSPPSSFLPLGRSKCALSHIPLQSQFFFFFLVCFF